MKKNSFIILLLVMVTFTGLYGLEKTTQPQDEYPNLRLTGFARVRYIADFTAGKTDGFSLGMARFGITGDISKLFTYSFSLEGTNGDPENKKFVYDVYIETSIVKNYKIRVGQFKYAFGLEQTTADADLEMVNKSEVVNNLIKPTRDIGVQINREFVFGQFRSNITLGLFNGSGSNADDENNRKTFIGRLTLTPVKGFTVGASYYDGTTGVADEKKRVGADLKWEIKKFVLKAEFVAGKDKGIKKDGFYAMAGYTLLPSTVLFVRYDRWNLNKDLADKDISRWTFGVNYFFGKNILWRTNYEYKSETPSIKNNIFVTQIQIKF